MSKQPFASEITELINFYYDEESDDHVIAYDNLLSDIYDKTNNLLISLYENKLVSTGNRWYVFDGKFWRSTYNEFILDELHNLFKGFSNEKNVNVFQDFFEQYDFYQEYSDLFHDENFMNKLDLNFNLLAFENGTYDLTLKQFREHRLEDYISLSTQTNFEPFLFPNILFPNFPNMFEKVIPDEQKRIQFIEVFMNCLSGKNYGENFYNLTSNTSLFSSVMKNMLGDYYVELDSNYFEILSRDNFSELIGKRLILVRKPKYKLSSSKIKQLTGCDNLRIINGLEMICFNRVGLLCFSDAEEFLDLTDGGLSRRILQLETV